MDKQYRGWGFEYLVLPFNFRLLTEFELIFFIKLEVRINLNINNSGYVNNIKLNYIHLLNKPLIVWKNSTIFCALRVTTLTI